jgi:histidine triad (HIT) family protein
MSDDCLFCKIVKGEIPSERVHEDERVIAFRDISPQAPVHLLIVPKEHVRSLDEAADAHRELLGHVLLTAKRLAAAEGIAGGYRVVNNCGASAGQSVFHIHFHVLGGRAMGWPPG